MWLWSVLVVLLTVSAVVIVVYPLFSSRYSARQRARRRLAQLASERAALYAEILKQQSDGAAPHITEQLEQQAALLLQREEQLKAALKVKTDTETKSD